MDAEGYLYRDNYDGTYTDQQGNIVNSQGDIIKSADPFSGNIPNPLIAPLAIPISQVVPSTGVNPDTTVQAKTINPLFVNQENPGPSNVGPVNTPIVQSSMPIYNTPVKVLTLPDGTTQSLALLTGANRKLGRVPVVF